MGRKCRPLHFNAPDECCPWTTGTYILESVFHAYVENMSDLFCAVFSAPLCTKTDKRLYGGAIRRVLNAFFSTAVH